MLLTLSATRGPFCLWLYPGKGRARLGKQLETSPLVLRCCLLLEPRGAGGSYTALRQDWEAGQEARLPDGGSESVTQEPWSSLQPVYLWWTCCLFAVCPSASLPAGYWSTLKELPDGPVMYHDYVFYLKLTYFSCIFISLVFIPHSGFSCHGSFIFPWDKEEFEYRLMYTSQVYRNPDLLKKIS